MDKDMDLAATNTRSSLSISDLLAPGPSTLPHPQHTTSTNQSNTTLASTSNRRPSHEPLEFGPNPDQHLTGPATSLPSADNQQLVIRIKEEDYGDSNLAGLDDSNLLGSNPEADFNTYNPDSSFPDSSPAFSWTQSQSQQQDPFLALNQFDPLDPIPLAPRRFARSISSPSPISQFGPFTAAWDLERYQSPSATRNAQSDRAVSTLFSGAPDWAATDLLLQQEQEEEQPQDDWLLYPTATLNVCSCPPEVYDKRPLNCYFEFKAEQHKIIKQQDPSLGTIEITKRVTALWNELPAGEKQRWKDTAERTREEHLANPDYKYKPRKSLKKTENKLSIEFCEKCGLTTPESANMSGARLSNAVEQGTAPAPTEQQFRKQPPTFAVQMPGQVSRQTLANMLRKGEITQQQVVQSYPGFRENRIALQAAPTQRASTSGPARSVAEFRRATQARRADSRADIVQQTAHFRQSSDSTLTLPYAAVAQDSPLRPRNPWEHQALSQLPRDASAAQIHMVLQRVRELYQTAVRPSVAQTFTPATGRFPPNTPGVAVQPTSARMQPPATPTAGTPSTAARAFRPELIEPMQIPVMQRIKSLARIAGCRGLSCDDSLQRMRGLVIAIEGTDLEAVDTMARFLRIKFADKARFAVAEWSPGFAQQLTHMSQPHLKDMRRMIELWDEVGEEILTFFEDPLGEYNGELASATIETVQPAPSRKRKSRADEDMDLESTTVLPVAILTQYMLTMTDVGSMTVSPNDKYSPLEHYQWLASQWRGMIGPDITIFISSPSDPRRPSTDSVIQIDAPAPAPERSEVQRREVVEAHRPSVTLPPLRTVFDGPSEVDARLAPMADDKDKMEEDTVSRPRTRTAEATVETRLDDGRAVLLTLGFPHGIPERELHRVQFEVEDWARGRMCALGW